MVVRSKVWEERCGSLQTSVGNPLLTDLMNAWLPELADGEVDQFIEGIQFGSWVP